MTNNAQMFKLGVIGVSTLILIAIVSITPLVGDTIDSTRYADRTVESISVFVLDTGTTATHVTCAIYDAENNRRIAVTEEQLITPDAWNVCNFAIPPKLDMRHDYILVAFANNDIAIPADGTNYVTDTGNTYDTFPSTIDHAGTEDSMLSIYAIYEDE